MKSYNSFINEKAEYTSLDISLEIRKQDVMKFVELFKTIEYLGIVGSSQTIEIFIDGDGAFDCKIKLPSEYKDLFKDIDANNVIKFSFE
jgi:hypothetical protein